MATHAALASSRIPTNPRFQSKITHSFPSQCSAKRVEVAEFSGLRSNTCITYSKNGRESSFFDVVAAQLTPKSGAASTPVRGETVAKLKVAINGFGRIGRNFLRCWHGRKDSPLDVIVVNDSGGVKNASHLLKYDSMLGTFKADVKIVDNETISVDGKPIKVVSNRDPLQLPWADLGIDIVIEGTGVFVDGPGAGKHIQAGAKKVVITAPAKGADIPTYVVGVNEKDYSHEVSDIISNASCTTNCLAPFVKVLDEEFGIVKGTMTTTHSYTGDQRLLDASHRDLRRARAAALNIVPTSTGAAKAVSLVLPQLKGKLNGIALRVPTPNVSVVDLVVNVEKKGITAEDVNAAFRKVAEGPLKGILDVCDVPLVSVDFRCSDVSSTIDSSLTMVMGDDMVKVVATVYRLDGKTGRVVQRYTLDDLNSTLGVQKAEVKTVALAKDAEGLVESVPTDKEMVQNLVYIMRKDYVMQYKSESGNVLWSVSLAEIEAEFQCREIKKVLGGHSSTYDNSPHSGYINNVFQLPCEKSAVVFRLRSHSLEEFLSVLDSLGGSFYLPYPDDKPYLGPADGIPLALPDNTDSQVLSLPPSKVEYHGILNMLSGNVTKMGSTNIFEKVIGPLTVLFSTFLSILGMLFYTSKQDKLRKEPKEFQVLTASKKKKTKKSGNNKNSINNGRRQKLMSYGNEHENSNGLAFAEGNEGKSFFTFSNTVDSPTDGRRIGKLLVSNKEIAKGSNGTVVLEGIYDGRPVAVKRLVQSHHGVALKEIQNLIASDQHPCIVRWYGVEYDQDFVYLALERCTCSLNDLIYVLSGSFKIQVTVHDESSNLLDEYTVRLNSIMENNKDIELWKANGYPSSHLLKLMRDVVSGVVHLHELGIIHRDLKPQNVLIIKDKSLWAKLSDMGISKRLPGDMTSLTQNATGSGSSGWQAPEQLRNGRQTRAVDLFSLGCVLFFCITGGRHPYGDSIERDVNIVNDRKDLFLIESMPEALDLLTSLLDPNPDLRPRARDVLPHPLFWTSEMRLSFLRDASDRVELEDREESSELLNALESTATLALNGKWDEKMESAFLNNIGRYRRYKFDSVRDLLRVIRNKLNHYRELPQEIQELLGNVPEGFDGYFSSRFPRLLIEVYKVLYRYCKEEEFFQKYIRAI